MRRIVVVGPPGSGKTTLARELSRRLRIPHVELDSLWWQANWVEAGSEKFATRARAVVATEAWIVDGNYFSAGSSEVIWPHADTIVWLDHGRLRTVARVVRRTVRRAVLRTELWSGNRESLRQAMRADSIITFAWKNHSKYGERYEGLDADPRFQHVTWVRLRGPRDVRRWLRSLP